MANLDIGSCISAGVDGFKKDAVTHIVAVLLVAVVGGVTSGILSGPMIVGYFKMIKNAESSGKAELNDVFKGFDDFLGAFLAYLVATVVVIIGFVLCIIPGFLIMALPYLALYLVSEGEKDGIKAFTRAFDIIKANLIPSCLCAFVLGIVGSLGVILCGVGIIFTLPIAFIGSYHMCKQLAADSNVIAA